MVADLPGFDDYFWVAFAYGHRFMVYGGFLTGKEATAAEFSLFLLILDGFFRFNGHFFQKTRSVDQMALW